MGTASGRRSGQDGRGAGPRCGEGAEAKVVRWVSRWRKLMFAVALRGLDDDGDAAEDIVQKAAVRALVMARRKPTVVEEVRNPRALLVRVTKNMVHDARRTENRRERILFENEDHVRENLFPAVDAGEGVDPGRDEILQVAQRILTPRQLAVVHLLFDGMGDPEIALEMGLTPVTVRRHRGEAIRRLQKRLTPPN